VRFRLERQLGDSGWITTVTGAQTPGEPGTVTGVSLDPRGHLLRAFDESGRTVPIRFAPPTSASESRLEETLKRMGLTKVSHRDVSGFQTTGGASATSGPARIDRSGAWLDQFLATPDSRMRTLASLQRRYGSPTTSDGSVDHYSETSANRTAEIAFDNQIGAVVEETLKDARTTTTMTRIFQRLDSTRYVLHAIRTDVARADGSSISLTQQFDNVHIEDRIP
jgi:hypothetical protein